MVQNNQTLKLRIISLLDLLPTESLQLLVEFVEFLSAKVKQTIFAGQRNFTPAEIDPSGSHNGVLTDAVMSEESLHRIWDNDKDAIYDR